MEARPGSGPRLNRGGALAVRARPSCGLPALLAFREAVVLRVRPPCGLPALLALCEAVVFFSSQAPVWSAPPQAGRQCAALLAPQRSPQWAAQRVLACAALGVWRHSAWGCACSPAGRARPRHSLKGGVGPHDVQTLKRSETQHRQEQVTCRPIFVVSRLHLEFLVLY